jgi:ribosomal protein S18 acetylase RimI-like enzyme
MDMNKELKYRNATTYDITKLIDLGVVAYEQLAKKMADEGWQKMKAAITNADMWHDLLSKSTGFVCCNGNEDIVGMAFLVPSGNAWFVYPNHWSYIRLVGVHPLYSGLGIGRRLTQTCVDAAKLRGENIIALHTSDVMNAARHIYETIGFEVLQEIEPRFGIRYWLYRMVLTN